ncbi:MAG: cytochrome c maturation protein CcmE [Anaerolineales bacterium]|nr:cytochrome c maturation protein CcmE [Anaerolineales bacterium]
MEEYTPLENSSPDGGKVKFFIGGGLIIAAVIYLIASSATANAQYFLTVQETLEKSQTGELADRNLRISGAVVGDTIEYEIETLTLRFEVAHVPAENEILEEEGGLAAALHRAVEDPDRPRIDVVYQGAKPDLLQNEAQAILTGYLDQAGVFQAEELLLKCPTKYEGAVPEQSP